MNQIIDTPPSRFTIENDTLTFHVKKGPTVIRFIYLFLATLFLFGPIVGFFAAFLNGIEVSLTYFVAIAAFALIGFYMLRLALWNTYGKEIIHFGKNSIRYHADFKYFTFNRKTYDIGGTIYFYSRSVGYEEDNIECLNIESENENWIIQCSTNTPGEEMQWLLENAETIFNGRVKTLENIE